MVIKKKYMYRSLELWIVYFTEWYLSLNDSKDLPQL